MYNFFYEIATGRLGGIELNTTNTAEFSKYLEQINIKLPDYIFKLLSKHGGKYFNNDVSMSNVESVPVASAGKIGIGQFIDIHDIESIKNILEVIPDDVFPILEAAAGDYVVVGINYLNLNKIFYWYHEANYGQDLYLISENFKDFMENLRIDNDEDNLREVISFNLDF